MLVIVLWYHIAGNTQNIIIRKEEHEKNCFLFVLFVFFFGGRKQENLLLLLRQNNISECFWIYIFQLIYLFFLPPSLYSVEAANQRAPLTQILVYMPSAHWLVYFIGLVLLFFWLYQNIFSFLIIYKRVA